MKTLSEEWLKSKGYELQSNGEYKKVIYEGNKSDGEHGDGDSGVQEREAIKPKVRKIIHRSKDKEANTGVGEAIVVINFRVPDRIRRDMDNMLATVFDSIVRVGLLPDDSIFDIGRTIITVEINETPGIDLLIIH